MARVTTRRPTMFAVHTLETVSLRSRKVRKNVVLLYCCRLNILIISALGTVIGELVFILNEVIYRSCTTNLTSFSMLKQEKCVVVKDRQFFIHVDLPFGYRFLLPYDSSDMGITLDDFRLPASNG